MISRRKFLTSGMLIGAGLFMPRAWFNLKFQRTVTTPTLDPASITKYVTPLLIPPAMPRMSEITGNQGELIDYYEVSIRQLQQQVLPTGLPKTTVWGYGPAADPNNARFNFPAYTIEASVSKPVRVKWMNQLTDSNNHFLPHLLPVDPTLHWANPSGPRDTHPMFEATPPLYTGPVPIVTHLHGAHVGDESDGFAEAWYLPDAADIPTGYSQVGTFYNHFKTKAETQFGDLWTPGSAVFQYPNDQPATALWYHDHTLGMTRLNVYAGPAGYYLLRGGPYDLTGGELPSGNYEIPILIQDRSFNSDGSLFYPDSREYFDGFTGPFIPDSDMHPYWNPEFFANTMVVNGNTWPVLNVEPRRYRLRLLNGCNARFLILRMVSSIDPPNLPPTTTALPFWQIGADSSFLKAPVELESLLVAPAERADVIIDFSSLKGQTIYLINEGPDEPFGGGQAGVDFEFANPATTGQVMQIIVGTSVTGVDTTQDPANLTLPAPPQLGPAIRTRQISLNELDSNVLEDVGPREAMLGLVGPGGIGVPRQWGDQISETPGVNEIETWEIYNFTADAHPIHPHLVHFEVLEREDMTTGVKTGPEKWESGYKDMVVSYPGAITRIKALFDKAGLYTWHCHILEHEDNEMMRPYQVLEGPGQGSWKLNFPLVNK